MKSRHISIFPGNSNGDSAANSPGGFASYRARYQQFLNQQTQRGERRANGTADLFRLVQGLFSFAIFIALFLAILTLFGIGLSRLGVIAQVSSGNSASGKHTANPATNKTVEPASPKKRSRSK